ADGLVPLLALLRVRDGCFEARLADAHGRGRSRKPPGVQRLLRGGEALPDIAEAVGVINADIVEVDLRRVRFPETELVLNRGARDVRLVHVDPERRHAAV